MIRTRSLLSTLLACLFVALCAGPCRAQSPDPSLFTGLRWREIGPYRGGRTRAASGVASAPNVFYIGAVDGGVWKSTDFGRSWQPIFDREPTGSIGALAVAPSDPNVIYVGSGEGLHRPDLSVGDGMYKSSDAGATWTHLGLREGQQIAKIAVDPHDASRLFVAVLGHPYAPNQERGIYRSTDGGQTFQKVLYKDAYTGGSDVAIDPSNSAIVYAALWQAQEGPWENGEFGGDAGGLFKSTDGGDTWQPVQQGLPTGVEQVNIAIAPSQPSLLYASVAAGRKVGFYRSDDAGASWSEITTDPRPNARIGGGDLPVPVVDPKNPDIVYVCTPVIWKSSDGGRTWSGLRGAPGGDDYQSIWINPQYPAIMLVGSDQGAIITENGGRSWSSWYNQPTAQVYHVGTDNAFPYRVCSGQQDSGSVCISSRGDWGEITAREWLPIGAEEYAAVAPDPLHPDLVFGGKLSRFDRRTGQTANVAPLPLRTGGFRALRTAPVVFSPVDQHLLFFAGNTLWQTRNGGQSWRQISPDLSRKTWPEPASLGNYRDTSAAKPIDRGVIYAVSPSPREVNLIWAGTDDGLIWVTRDDGQHWNNVTPPQLSAWQKVAALDAGHFDAQTAYAAINTFRLDDLHPHIYRTHDGGKTWTEIANGIPGGAAVNVVREDPDRKGLLFAGSENQAYVSFDDGDHWQSLRLNMPATSIRDLAIKGDDLIAGTHGRGFWILDDITPLRQVTQATAGGAYLFRPELAYRVRWDVNTDTPLPPDVPAGQNPPEGAILDYYLPSAAAGPVKLAIYDHAGRLVRQYSSDDPVPALNPGLDIPTYWVRPPQRLSAEAGEHRFLWDMHLAPPPGFPANYPMQAVAHNTAPAPNAPWVLPGAYTVKLTVDGHTYTQPLTVHMDPRVQVPLAGLETQFNLSQEMYDDLVAASHTLDQMHTLRVQVQQRRQQAGSGAAAAAIAAYDTQAQALEGARGGGRFAMFSRGATAPVTLTSVRGSLFMLMSLLQEADVEPTTQAVAAIAHARQTWAEVLARWQSLTGPALARLNAQLRQANLATVEP